MTVKTVASKVGDTAAEATAPVAAARATAGAEVMVVEKVADATVALALAMESTTQVSQLAAKAERAVREEKAKVVEKVEKAPPHPPT